MFGARKSIEPSSAASPIRFHAVTLATFFGASAAPTPLYRIYQQEFAVTPVVITIVFAVYAFALLCALLIAGSISDHLGRKPVIFAAGLRPALPAPRSGRRWSTWTGQRGSWSTASRRFPAWRSARLERAR
jgi:MFS family permease